MTHEPFKAPLEAPDGGKRKLDGFGKLSLWGRCRGKTLKDYETAIYGTGKQHTIHFSNHIAKLIKEPRADVYYDEELTIIAIKPSEDGNYKISLNKGTTKYRYKTMNVTTLLKKINVEIPQRCTTYWDDERGLLWFKYKPKKE